MCSLDSEIVLEIENTSVTCKKRDLVSNSDYFKAMLEGNFIERSQSRIKLEDVDLKAMNIILIILWDESYVIPSEDILLVLQTACMLQFTKIRSMCLDRIIEMLSPKNCVKIWCITERLDIIPLFLKAKSMALIEFLEVKDTDCILEFTLEEICQYLGHINLQTDSEITVFQTAMRWWYENSEQYTENSTQILIKLLSCIDFQNITQNYLKEIILYPNVVDNLEITQILSCISLLKSGALVDHFSENIKINAQLLLQTRNRVCSSIPCILVDDVHSAGKTKKVKTVTEQQQRIIYYDKFKRKRLYETVNNGHKSDFLTVIYYDYLACQFKKFLDIGGRKCSSLDGFELLGYKEFVFLYGGEFLLGKGNWNSNFWVYDTIRERWERKCVMPFPRRHFETCLVGDILYIVGGTGVFRVIQENMFWYSYKHDKWSAQMALPCSGRQIKCCSFLNELFILDINYKCGYFFDDNTFHWLKMDLIIDDDTLISHETEFAIFSYKENLYIKGKKLLELKVVDKKIVVVSIKDLPNVKCDKMELVLCDKIVYTLYKYRCEDFNTYCFETYNLETGDVDFVFKDIAVHAPVTDIDGDTYSISSNLKILSFQHYSLAVKNNLINNSFL